MAALKVKNIQKEEKIICPYNNTNCMFYYGDNGHKHCIAEWCIFSRFPKIIITTREVKCIFCDNIKTVSTLSGQKEYVCPECREKIKELMKDE